MQNTAQIIRPVTAPDSKRRMKVATPLPLPQKRVKRPVDTSSLLGQVRLATAPKNRLALVYGAATGVAIPIASYTMAHSEIMIANPRLFAVKVAILVGGLVYSSRSVFQWWKLITGSAIQSLAFVVLSEGILVFSDTEWLRLTFLGYLCIINALANGCKIALKGNE